MIPEFDENGNLPPGVHFCKWEEFLERFDYNDRRVRSEFLVPLDTLRRTPITKEDLKSSKRRAKSQELSSKS